MARLPIVQASAECGLVCFLFRFFETTAINASDLAGAALDWAVAKSEGADPR